MKNNKGGALTDFLVIILLCLATASAIQDNVRIQSRRSQQQRVKTIRKPDAREINL